MEELAAALGAVAMVAVIGWIVRTALTSRRQTKIATLHAELQTSILDRFGYPFRRKYGGRIHSHRSSTHFTLSGPFQHS